jgi:hypothetical protein
MRTQGQRPGTLSAAWMRKWNLKVQSTNPPFVGRIPGALDYLRRLEIDSAYMTLQGHMESQRAYKRRLCTTIHNMMIEATGNQQMSIARLWPQANWKVAWKNPHDTPVTASSRTTWFKVIHDMIPTNDRLHRIRLTPTDICRNCDKKDTLEYCIIYCGEAKEMWLWTKQRLAQMLRKVPGRIPDGWLICPQLTLWPPQLNHTVLWLLANFITFRAQKQLDLTLQDFIDFPKQRRWKLYVTANRRTSVGYFLTTTDTTPP